MNRMQFSFCLMASALLALTNVAAAQELYRSELASGAGWAVNATSADTAATFGYDYSVNGIPEAPNSRGGDTATSGLKAEANIALLGTVEAFSAYPVGENFTGNYQLRFDAWANYDVDEVINGGSAGTTEFIGGGIGYDNVSADIGSGAQVIATGEGGSGSDWRAFKDGTFLAPGEMAGGTRQGSDPYYADFLPGVVPPAAQGQPALEGIAGSPGFQWITFQISHANGQVTMKIEKPGGDQLNIATLDCSDASCTTEGNISLFYADFFTSVTDRPDLTFGVFDNVEVTRIPEPASALLLLCGALALVARRRRG